MLHARPSLVQRLATCAFALVAVSGSHVSARPKAAKHAPPSPTTTSSDGAANAVVEPEPVPAAQASTPAAAADEKPKQATAATQPTAATKADAAPAATAQANEKLAALRAEVSSLTDDLVEARSRAAMLGKTLFKTQVRVRVQNLAAPDPVLAKLVLKLDGAPIYRGDGTALNGDDARQVFQGFIAPGAHVLSVDVEQRSRDDAAYGYTLHESYRFASLREKRSELTLILDDDSDLASEFPDDSEGEYDVRIKLRVKTKDLTEP